MIINYTLTIADYRDMRTAMGFSNLWLRYGAIAWLGLMLTALAARECSTAAEDPTAPATSVLSVPDLLPTGTLVAGLVTVVVISRRQVHRCRDIGNTTRWVLSGVGVIGLLAGLSLLATVPGHLSGSFWIWIGLIVFYFLVFRSTMFGGAVRKIWDAQTDQHRPKQLQLIIEGVVLSDGVSRLEYNWDAFAASRETNTVFVLVINRYAGLTVPKRAFPDEASINAFATALKQNIVPRTGGFPIRACPPPNTPNTDLPVACLAPREDAQP